MSVLETFVSAVDTPSGLFDTFVGVLDTDYNPREGVGSADMTLARTKSTKGYLAH